MRKDFSEFGVGGCGLLSPPPKHPLGYFTGAGSIDVCKTAKYIFFEQAGASLFAK